ncbi:cysteine hydrolase family protein [Budvicia aquatica]|uniref:cysteine hydrolase family protein n=1 Tax=Budvicia aquatica TaxID=82979 RepID=UPI001B64817F|nr:cysteine hydrolase family protein [Budvicia aquatica]MBP9641952.1 cysteine hydrolase [Budvicia sp.]GKX52520.1 isochorismatase [Budvicia aquatica]
MPISPKRALIVIDVQNEYFTGSLPIEYPPTERSLSNILLAMDTASASGIPVVIVQNSAPEESPIFAKGSDGWALHPLVASRSCQHYVEKMLPSAFSATDLMEWLTERQIDTLTVVGYMTHNCDASTINHAAHAGFKVEFLADASGSLSYKNQAGSASAEEIHRVFSVVFHSRFASVVSTKEWVDAVNVNQAIERDSIWRSYCRAHI